MNFLKAQDIKDLENATNGQIFLHELDENDEYNEKIDYILENENCLNILEESESYEQDFNCDVCGVRTVTEIKCIGHIWQKRQEKSRAENTT